MPLTQWSKANVRTAGKRLHALEAIFRAEAIEAFRPFSWAEVRHANVCRSSVLARAGVLHPWILVAHGLKDS